MDSPYTIVVPCYNEESRFPVEKFRSFAVANPDIHFLLVNDGSRDQTVATLRRAQAGIESQVEVLDRPVNMGKAEAVRAGVMAAIERRECRVVGFWDADLATPLETIRELTDVLDGTPGLAMVFGSRVKLLGRHVDRRAVRHYLGRVFATAVSIAIHLPIYDSQCGAKIFRVDRGVRQMFGEPFSSRWVFDVEILARFIQMNGYDMAAVEASIYEYPLKEWRDVAGSRVKPSDFFRAFFDVVRIWNRYRQR